MGKTTRWVPVVLLVALCVTGAVLWASPDEYSRALADLDEAAPEARAGAVEYLVSLGASGLGDLLDELAGDPTPLQAAGLAEAIRTIGIGASDVEDVSSLLASTYPPTRHAAITVLALQAASARDALETVATTDSELPALRAAAAVALGGAGAQARSTLREVVSDEDAPDLVRMAALRSLARVSSDGADDARNLAASPRQPWSLRRAAILALGDPNAAGDAPLAYLLSSREAPVREAVLEAMVARAGTTNVALVAGRLTDTSADVRLAALRGLSLLGAAAGSRQAVIVADQQEDGLPTEGLGLVEQRPGDELLGLEVAADPFLGEADLAAEHLVLPRQADVPVVVTSPLLHGEQIHGLASLNGRHDGLVQGVLVTPPLKEIELLDVVGLDDDELGVGSASMKALEFTVDGQRVCTGGLPEFGVVLCVITGVRRLAAHTEDGQDAPEWTHHMNVSGSHEPERGVKEHLNWCESDLRVGQEVVVRLVEVGEADEPVQRQRETQRDEIEQKRRYLDYLKRQIETTTAELEEVE